MSHSTVPAFPPKVLGLFIEVTRAEISADTFQRVLDKASLPVDFSDPAGLPDPAPHAVAWRYAQIQKAIRSFYGRGARGTLIRVGRLMWPRLLAEASLPHRAQAALIHLLPLSMRRKLALELLSQLIIVKKGDITVHTLDMDLLLADHASGATCQQTEISAICHVTLGLVQESLYWATGREHDVAETDCLAKGSDACEFTVTIGAK